MIFLESSDISLAFTPAGHWTEMTVRGLPGNCLHAVSETFALDFQVDGDWQIARHGAALVSHVRTSEGGGEALTLVYQVGEAHALTVRYTLPAGARRLERTASLLPRQDGGRLEAFRLDLPGLAAGEAADCTIDVPGPWYLHSWVRPGTRYAALLSADISFHSAPDGGFGIVAISNKAAGVTLASWMDTRGECGYQPHLAGDGARLSLSFTNGRALRLKAGEPAVSDRHCVALAASLPEALAACRADLSASLPLAPHTPDWVRDMTLLEIYPAYFPGGFREITARLPFYREIGFNTIYLMPHWRGGYMPLDLFAVEPSLGTPDDLREMTGRAHALGMRVLFDMVIHGMSEQSALVRERPDFFCHDAQGQVARHPTWKSMATDWASPGYRAYLAALARHDAREYGIDGYRVDAASFKGANWDPHSPFPAYRSGCDSPAVMQAVLQALRETNPDAVLLSEVFGPVFYTVSNLAHDNQTEAPTQFLEQMARGEATAADYKAHLAAVFDLLPPGANRVFFARNHDTSWFHRFDGYTPRFLALDAIHALCAIPEVFAGDPGHPPSPDDTPAVWEFYRALFAARREYPALTRGELDLRGVEASAPNVFTALRIWNGRRVLIVVSLSEQTEAVEISGSLPLPETASLRDVLTGKALTMARGRLVLRPFAVAVGQV